MGGRSVAVVGLDSAFQRAAPPELQHVVEEHGQLSGKGLKYPVSNDGSVRKPFFLVLESVWKQRPGGAPHTPDTRETRRNLKQCHASHHFLFVFVK